MDYSHWKSHFEGRLLTQADDEYAVTRRIWNGMIDKKPAAVSHSVVNSCFYSSSD